MGAYAALLLSKPLCLKNAVLVSPQWSIFPDQPPFDLRYEKEAKTLRPVLGDLAASVAAKLRGVVLFDPIGNPVDGTHARLISAHAPRLAGVAMALGGNPATEHLLQTPQYKALRNLALSGKFDPALYSRLHVAARVQSPLYQAALQSCLLRRSQRIS